MRSVEAGSRGVPAKFEEIWNRERRKGFIELLLEFPIVNIDYLFLGVCCRNQVRYIDPSQRAENTLGCPCCKFYVLATTKTMALIEWDICHAQISPVFDR